MIIPPTPVPSPGGKGGGLRFMHVKVYWVYLKLEIHFCLCQCLFMHFFIFTSKLRAYVILLFNLPTLNKTYLIWMIIFAKNRFRPFFCNNAQKMIINSRFSYNHIHNANNYLKRRVWLIFSMSICTSLRLGKEQS